jgi:putative oxidoreductase
MVASLFVIQGWQAFRRPETLAERAKPVTDRFAPVLKAIHPDAPTDAETLVRMNGAAQVAGGLLLATGHATTPAALILAGSLVPTTLAAHAFWQASDPDERAQQRVHFFKNVSLFGGLLFAALDNEGRPGLVWRTEHLGGHAADRASRFASKARRAAHTARRETKLAYRAVQAGRHSPI